MGIDRVLFAVDYPSSPQQAGVGWLKAAPLSDSEREAIAQGNATKLLKL